MLALGSDPVEVPGAMFEGLAQALTAGAVAVVKRVGDDVQFFSRFMDGLVRELPFDAALAQAAGSPQNYLLAAGNEWLNGSTLREFVRRSKGRVSPRLTQALAQMGSDLIARSTRRTRSGYRRAPPPAAEAVRGAAEGSPSGGDTEEQPPRWLQAQVHAFHGSELIQLERAFTASAKHQLGVCIAPGRLDWLRLDERFTEISFWPGEQYLDLDILATFIGEGIDIPSAVKRIRLPRQGSSEIALFEFTVSPECKRLEIPITVMHEGRYVQRGVLSGPVVPLGAGAASAEAIRFERSAIAEADHATQSPADLTLIKEKDEVTVRFKGEFYPVDLSGIRMVVDAIRDKLYAAATRPRLQKEGLKSEPALDLLRFLAVQGALLRKKLFKGHAVNLDAVKVVEVISKFSADSFPVEFLYDLDGPDDDAELCPCFLAEPQGEAVRCKAKGDPLRWICPTAFWSLNRVLGRQLPVARPIQLAGPSRERPQILRFQNAILAGSNKVDEENPNAMADLATTAQGVVNVKLVQSWNDWVKEIRETHPTLLVALPHNEWLENLQLEALEIGDADRLRYDRVGAEHVRLPEGSTPPVVLLLGCTTAAGQVAYQDFIAAFRGEGAAVVVGTMAKVLGHHAAPVAQALIAELCERTTPTTFGEVMRRVRATMLRQGNVMCLSLAAFGDVDWQLQ